MTSKLPHLRARARQLLPICALLGGWLVLSAQACQRNAQPGGHTTAAQTNATASTPQTTGATTGATTSGTTGGGVAEPKPGDLQPKSPGPQGAGVFILSGMKGYLEPCGCTADVKLGGVDRIGGYLDAARKLYSKTVVLDGGDLLFEEPSLDKEQIPQARAKIEVLVKAHKRYGTQVTVPGDLDFALGADTYLDAVKRAGIEPLAVNASIKGSALKGWRLFDLGEVKLGVIGVVDPSLYEKVKEVKATPAEAGVKAAIAALKQQGATTLLALHHGDLTATKTLLEAHPELDFALIGQKPRETDQVDDVGEGFTLEVYDQGRYLGVLKLMGGKNPGRWLNARTGSKGELETIKRQIEHVEGQIKRLPPAPPGKEPPLLKRLRERLTGLKRKRWDIEHAELKVPADRRAFTFSTVPMEPGYPLSAPLKQELVGYTKALAELNKQIDFKVRPVEAGKPFYVGSAQCQTCHAAAYDVWTKTRHGHALDTLTKLGKDQDQDCIKCHVVGYDKPGGSIMNKLSYEAELRGQKITKQLQHVGCESCHGPGSMHIEGIFKTGKAAHISRAVPADQCMQCHVKEHSPKFNYDVYVKQIVAPGHGLKASP